MLADDLEGFGDPEEFPELDIWQKQEIIDTLDRGMGMKHLLACEGSRLGQLSVILERLKPGGNVVVTVPTEEMRAETKEVSFWRWRG